MDRRLRNRWDTVLRAIPLPVPFDASTFCDELGRHLGRQIVLVPQDGAADEIPCGLLARTAAADYIFFRTGGSWLHQQHNVLHEVGHLLADHGPGRPVGPGQLGVVLRHLDPTRVERVLARGGYDDEVEQEAELIATLLGRRVNSQPRPAPSTDSPLARVSCAFSEPLQ